MGVSALDCAFIVRSLLLLWCYRGVLAAEFAFIFAPKNIISFHPTKRGDREKRSTDDDDNDDDIIIKQSAVIKYVFVVVFIARKNEGNYVSEVFIHFDLNPNV